MFEAQIDFTEGEGHECGCFMNEFSFRNRTFNQALRYEPPVGPECIWEGREVPGITLDA